ncbi:WbqC-like protein family [Methanocaldococcus lauensis]|uniref:WbqC-like protein family n=1 Tax=Methanocaldococcus lauensis TaxID=2546128 RepID=A0A8D6SX94_9EURY|nr:WbqC family protein [Methanocaldococcus lauensis]CAB3290115.1 WbqC-like protein family [Methanocaldococcus lauensis]
MKVVILQPMYLPWMGYFGMIDVADVFVFYDDVQFSNQSWQQRNRVKTANGIVWLTVPVIKKFGQRINEVRINNSTNWRKKHWKTIKYSYSKAPYFKDYKDIFEEIYAREWNYLYELNIYIIKTITEILGLKTKFILSSELNVEGKKTDRLIRILKKINATEYISGPSAKAYIEPEKFKRENIGLYWFEFNHPKYPQIHGDFVPYLSVIDLLFNVGEVEAVKYIKEGQKNAIKKDERV